MKARQIIEGDWFHGSPSGEFNAPRHGIHVGTRLAARQALNARIGWRADGKDWDGTQEYGKTLLAGKKNLEARGPYNVTGFNCNAPDDDFYAPSIADRTKYSDGTVVPFNAKPTLFGVDITGPMLNSKYSPRSDSFANSRMRAQLKKGKARTGYYYTNDGEDTGSISAVVPTGAHLARRVIEAVIGKPSGLYRAGPGERVVAAALKIGKDIYLGDAHSFALEQAAADNRKLPPNAVCLSGPAFGFYTSAGRFLSREDALRLARTRRQMVAHPEYAGAGLDSSDVKKNPHYRWKDNHE